MTSGSRFSIGFSVFFRTSSQGGIETNGVLQNNFSSNNLKKERKKERNLVSRK
jgi:hypothetical protein